ncbi:MAG: CBS domain-containing protein [Gammaproteobacteria bacterium]|nr:CBS domain-containing protein [Gammaproteobacteria bacterium]
MTINPISRYFITNHPRDSARTLENFDPAVLAEYLDEIPARDLANVFRHMNPSATSACLASMQPEKSAAIIENFSIERASYLLRRMSITDRFRTIRKLSPIVSNMIKIVMRYPAGTVGQIMNPNVFAVYKNRSVSEVIESLKTSYDKVRSKVYIVDDRQQLVGMVFVRDLLVSDPELPVEKIMREPESTLSARASLESIKDHPQWKDRDNLPVVDQSSKFIGILKRGVLQDALGRKQETEQQDEGIIGAALDVAEMFWGTCANIITPPKVPSDEGQKK